MQYLRTTKRKDLCVVPKLHGFTPAKPCSPLPAKATHPTRLGESLARKGKLVQTPPRRATRPNTCIKWEGWVALQHSVISLSFFSYSHECAHTHLSVSAVTRILHAPPFPKFPVSQEGTFITSCLVSSDTPDPIFARASLQPLFLLSPTSTFQMTSPGLHRPRSMLSTTNAPVLPLKF
jgi:hypothetical protein